MSEAPQGPDSAQASGLPVVPGYRIIREIGRGGMATVYLAVQESLGREVALKLLTLRLAEDPGASERFVREARTAARLVHRHIVGIHDVGEHDGQPYLAMEYLPGGTITGPLAPQAALVAAREISLALDHAHRQGVVHRDIKPENILRRADHSCALADFGIARTADVGAGLTQDGVTLGTPHYMSPEQLQGARLDGRSDIYSLGVVLYQLLTGELPYKGTDGWSVGLQHISAPIPRLPAALARYQPLVDKLLAKDPARRPQTGHECAQLMEAAMAGAGGAETRMIRLSPVRRAFGLPLALVGVLLLGILGWSAWDRWRDSGRTDPAGPVADAASSAGDTSPAQPHPARSIAVLPFANLSGDARNDYFSDGLAETTLDMLAQLKDLKVIARTSSFAFKGRTATSREIGQALGAANLLEGSVQQAGDTVRVRVQLIRAADGAQVWSQRFDRKLTDVFKIQDEIASAVVAALEVALPAPEQQRMLRKRTENVAAYQEYLRGMALMPARKVPEMRTAAKHFERAIELDPHYARAYVAAHDVYLLLGNYATITPAETARANRYLERALEIAPDLGEAHVSRGAQHQANGRNDEARREFELGLKLAPGYATGFQWFSEFLGQNMGDLDGAVTQMEQAYRLDPLSPVIRDLRVFTYSIVGRTDEALAISNQLIADDPTVARSYGTRATLHSQKGDMVAAMKDRLEQDRLDPASVGFRANRCHMLITLGALAEAERCVSELEAAGGDSGPVTATRARLLSARGEYEAALAVGRTVPTDPALWVTRTLVLLGRDNEALTILRRSAPQLFGDGPLRVPAAFASVALTAGYAELKSGDQAKGRALLHATIAALEGRPYFALAAGQGWMRAEAYALLGDKDRAFAALKEGVDAGFFLQLGDLDKSPFAASLQADPRYERVLAPARRRLATELARLRKAGLL